MCRRLAACGLALTIAVLTAAPALAGTITFYSNRSDFVAQLGSVTVETFTNDAHLPITTGELNSSTNYTPAMGTPITPGMIQPGVTYSVNLPITGIYGLNIDWSSDFGGPFLDSLSFTGVPETEYLTPLTTTFDSPVGGFGFDTHWDFMGTGFNVTINFADGSAQTLSYVLRGSGFFGFASDSPDIVSAIIEGNHEGCLVTGGCNFGLDNFTFESSTPIPEPASLFLLGSGLAGAVGAIRRRRR
jgi:hypothetical protein